MKTTCAACSHDVVINGTQGKCPYCGAEVNAAPAGSPPSSPTSSPAASAPSNAQPEFPERMKANKVLAGRVCQACSQPIELGTEVWNCPNCSSTMHNACHERTHACANPACAGSQSLELQPSTLNQTASAEAGPMVECRFCKEKIQAKARKCRFCGEYQNEAERKRMEKYATQADSDENLSTAEVIFGLLCGGIACIMAIVWMIQGKKKGGKLLLLAICSIVFWNLIGALRRG